MTTTIEGEPPLCSVCSCNEEAHKELNHEFNTEGRLIPKKKPPAVQVRPAGSSAGELTGLMLRLVHILEQKGLLNDDDVRFITSPSDGGSRGDPADRQVGVYPARPPG